MKLIIGEFGSEDDLNDLLPIEQLEATIEEIL